MKKKIKDLTVKEFYIWLTKELEEIRPYCFGENPLNMLKDQTVIKYLEEHGDKEIEVDD